VIIAHEPDPRRAESIQSARLAAEVLEKNVESGTGTRARIPGQHAAGKTGTAQSASDGWFVGFTPYLATAVWIGSPEDNEAVEIQGTGITGGSFPAEIWGRYMRAWHEGLEERELGEPEPTTRSGRYLSLEGQYDSGGGYNRRRSSSSSGGGTTTTVAPEVEETTTTATDDTTPPSTGPPTTGPPSTDP
jgi:membrane peptidoglycan carboxypeptidase